MGLASLLSHFGIDAPRIVSAVGRVDVGGSGPGIAITPHTFHGGDDPIEAAEAVPRPWWMDLDALDRERVEMAAWFPGFREVDRGEGEPPAWVGEIDTGRGRFRVLIAHRADRGLPWVIPFSTNLGKNSKRGRVKPPHLYLSGRLCVAAQDDWDPARDTAVQVVAWTAHWLACYVEWFVTDRWPSEGVRDVAA